MNRLSKRRRLILFAAPPLAVLLAGCVLYAVLSRSKGEVVAEHKYFQKDAGRTLAIAHRGGAGLWPENTLYAFERAGAWPASFQVAQSNVNVHPSEV